MKRKIFTPIIAMLLIVFIGSCQKDQSNNVTPNSSVGEKLGSTASLAMAHPNAVVLKGINLGVAGNFVILTKTGITSVYKSTITGNVGTSPITGGK
jgi:hypothetical protein